MRLRILSDLHEEFAPKFAKPLQPPESGELGLARVEADVTILAGDIGNAAGAVQVAKRACFANTQVLLVPGNHEYYGTSLSAGLAAMRSDAATSAHVQVLHKEVCCLSSVRFICVTLWTDYALLGEHHRQEAMQLATPVMADYRLISKENGDKLTATDTVAMHEAELAWLSGELAKPWAGKTVVVSHHAPHPKSVADRFAGNPINGGFVSDLSRVMPGVDVWIHGHTHDGFDYVVPHKRGQTRVVANPAGYRKRAPLGEGLAGGFWFENPSFNPNLVIEV